MEKLRWAFKALVKSFWINSLIKNSWAFLFKKIFSKTPTIKFNFHSFNSLTLSKYFSREIAWTPSAENSTRNALSALIVANCSATVRSSWKRVSPIVKPIGMNYSPQNASPVASLLKPAIDGSRHWTTITTVNVSIAL